MTTTQITSPEHDTAPSADATPGTPVPVRLDFDQHAAGFSRAMAHLDRAATKDARAIGETEQRLYALPVWRETPFFSLRERAALAFAEEVTLLATTHVPD